MDVCEFCTQHGEGKKWYENMKNYSEEMFYQVNFNCYGCGLCRPLCPLGAIELQDKYPNSSYVLQDYSGEKRIKQ